MKVSSQFHYLIVCAVPGILEQRLLVIGLQEGYDAGVEGRFEVSYTAKETVVTFERTVADDDGDYVRGFAEKLSLTMQQAAQLQLAYELREGAGTICNPFISKLFNQQACVVDPHKALDLALAEA